MTPPGDKTSADKTNGKPADNTAPGQFALDQKYGANLTSRWDFYGAD